MRSLLLLIFIIGNSIICLSQQDTAIMRQQRKMIAQFDQYNRDKLFNFKLLDIDGNLKKLSDFKHKVILIDFWASWCEACVKHIPLQFETYQRLRIKYGNQFEWINISVDKDTLEWKNLLKSKGKAGINLIGNIDFIQDTYHIEHYPTLVLIDKNYRILGFDIARLSWGGPIFLEYLISMGISGINSGDAWKQMSTPGTNKTSEEFQKWEKFYYK